VLVVDDEPIVRDVVVRYLRRDGFATLEAGTGEEAMRLLEREVPSLVVLDVMLPGTDGLEICRRIRATSDLPIVLLTARGDEADRIVGAARTKAERLESETKAKADRLESDARTRSQMLDAETEAKRREALGDLEKDKASLNSEIENLRLFEREYRSRLKSYFTNQLAALDGERETGSLPGSGPSEHAPKRLKSILGEDESPSSAG